MRMQSGLAVLKNQLSIPLDHSAEQVYHDSSLVA